MNSPLIAVTDMGTSWRLSVRFWAVTRTSSSSAARELAEAAATATARAGFKKALRMASILKIKIKIIV